MADNRYELILEPRIKTISADDAKLKADIQSLAASINAKGGLKLDISIDTTKIKAIETQLTDLQTKLSKIGSVNLGGISGVSGLSKSEIQNAEQLLAAQKKVNAELEKRLKLLEQSTQSGKKSTSNQDSIQKQTERINQAVERQLSGITRIESSWSKLKGNPEYVAELDRIKNLYKSISDFSLEKQATKLGEANTQLKVFKDNANNAGLAQKSFSDRVAETSNRLSAYLISMLGYQMILGNIRNAIQAVKELDLSLTEIRKVSDLAGDSLNRFVDRAFEAASQIGRTGKDLIDATAEFRRAGYELESAFEMGQAALIMTNVGDGIDSVEEASSALIATLRGFKLPESEVMGVVDAINQVSNTAPITFKDLTEGLRRVSGTLSQTGTDLSSTIGLLTGGFAQLRDIESVSSALVFISQRKTQNISANLFWVASYVQKCA